MAFLERTLMGLKLVLGKFDIDIGKYLSIKQKYPEMDNITAVISLIQILHDLDYKIKFVYEDGYKIRSSKLNWEVTTVIGEARSGKLMLQKNMSLDKDMEYRIAMIKHCVVAPENVPFTNQDWIYFVGFYNILTKQYTDDGIVHVLLAGHSKYLPYFMIAEEQIAEVKSYAE